MATPITALARGGHVYTILANHDKELRYIRYIGFKDGQRWGAFSSKKEWAAAVKMEPDFNYTPPVTEQYVRTLHAEMLSTWEGARILKQLEQAARKAKT